MAATAKFEASTSSPDAVAYMNGQRGSSYTASLDRSSSFREGAESRLSGSVSNQTKSEATASLVQAVMPDLKSVVDHQKLPRHGELKRTIASTFGISPEDSTCSEVSVKNPSPEELKRAKSVVHEANSRARERTRLMTEAVSNLEKTLSNVVTRKRSRSDSFSNERSSGAMAGANLNKISSAHGHLGVGGLDQGLQRTEERAKSSIPNRRIRSSMADMRLDGRPNASQKPCSPVNREREMTKHGNGGAALLEEKSQPSGMVGGWEKSKMKKKRSGIKSDVSDAVRARPIGGGDREPKQGFQQRAASEAPSRLSGAAAFRPAAREEGINGNPGVSKTNTSVRTPRTAIGGPRTSPVVHLTASPDDSDISQSVTKLHGGSGSNSRKRSASTQSPSPPVTQWGGQRHTKMSRVARRSNFPVVSGPDDITFPETEEIRNNEGADFLRHPTSFLGQQTKMKGDHVLSSSLSENEETFSENKMKDKIKKCTELDERGGQALHKPRNLLLPSRKNRVPGEGEEDVEDGIRRQGRPGRLPTPSRSAFPTAVEKLDHSDSVKQSRNLKLECERVESKPGRPPNKKIQERKPISRQRPVPSNETMEITVEKSDDREELLAAAKLALATRYTGPSIFWKQLDPIFRLVSSEGATFLTQQVQLLSEYTASNAAFHGDLQYSKSKADDGYASLKSPSLSFGKDDNHKEVLNMDDFNVYDRMVDMAGNPKNGASPIDHTVHAAGTHSGISICQLLLSAMIEEDDEENVESRTYCQSSREECFSNDAQAMNCTTDADISSLENSQRVDMMYSNGYTVNTNCRYYDEPRLYDAEQNDTSSEFQYSQMSVEDRIFLELNEVGLSPEPVPELGSSEDEGIDESIGRLEEKLHSQVTSNKDILSKLEKLVMEAKEVQKRDLERVALSKLVGIAYKKYMAVCGPNAPIGKNNKINKHHALAFVKRTLARFQTFDQTGKNCFSEPPYSEMFQSVTYGEDPAGCTETIADGTSWLTNQPGVKGRLPTNSYTTSSVVDPTLGKEDSLSNKVKKRELLLNVGNLTSSTKGKRSERDRDGKRSNKDMNAKNGASRTGRPGLPNAKGERKTKTKPKHKTTQLSASLNDLISNEPSPSPSINKPHDTSTDRNTKQKGGSGVPPGSNNMEPIDLSNLQIPEIDVLGVGDEFSGNPQDISSWFNFDDDALQDQDLMGLEIPMDDLSELNMMV